MQRYSGIGKVELLATYGSDWLISNAAGMSTGIPNKDMTHVHKRISHCLKNGHESVFEHGLLHLEVEAPLFVTRQWLRHRISSVNEKSGRYTMLDFCYIPDYIDNKEAEEKFIAATETSMETYRELIDMGIRYEVARMITPVNVMTKFVWTVNLRSLMNFLKQRLDAHAQYETRELAGRVERIFSEEFPITYSAHAKYVRPDIK